MVVVPSASILKHPFIAPVCLPPCCSQCILPLSLYLVYADAPDLWVKVNSSSSLWRVKCSLIFPSTFQHFTLFFSSLSLFHDFFPTFFIHLYLYNISHFFQYFSYVLWVKADVIFHFFPASFLKKYPDQCTTDVKNWSSSCSFEIYDLKNFYPWYILLQKKRRHFFYMEIFNNPVFVFCSCRQSWEWGGETRSVLYYTREFPWPAPPLGKLRRPSRGELQGCFGCLRPVWVKYAALLTCDWQIL